jgi:hypothetical protein
LADHNDKNGNLALLDSDRVRAKQEYERLRFKLIRYFAWNQVRCPDEFADETSSAYGAAFLRTFKFTPRTPIAIFMASQPTSSKRSAAFTLSYPSLNQKRTGASGRLAA